MVLMMILEYKTAQVFSCFTVSHSLQQCLFSRFWFFKNQEVLIFIEVTIRVFRTAPPPVGGGVEGAAESLACSRHSDSGEGCKVERSAKK